MKINKSYLHLFKKYKSSYLYYLDNGVFLRFDYKELIFTGLECFYTPRDIDTLEKKAQCKLNLLLNRGILDID